MALFVFRLPKLLGLFVGFLVQGPVHHVGGNVVGAQGPSRPLVAASWVHIRDVRRSLADVLDDALGKTHRKAMDVRVDRLKDALRPIYTALPKNGNGLLSHSTVRYALHRYFVHKHGMYVKGLEPAGEAWNSSSPTDILEDQVPSFVQHLFEECLRDGFGLQELALLAATLEHFVHSEVVERLRHALRLSGVGVEEQMDRAGLERVLDVYLLLFMMGPGYADRFKEKHLAKAQEVFPSWAETQRFIREVRDAVLPGDMADKADFAAALRVGEAVSEQYGRFQDRECRTMAKALAAKEDQGTGRVKLSDFYQAGWQFRESKEYLLSIGAAEDASAAGRYSQEARVIIPNYIASVTNCITSSSMYSVCCIDPCEDLLAHLERRVAAPSARPEQILEIVAGLPSPTVDAPRELPESLTRRLAEIAATHSSQIPLHGRLFSQWMHHAYPRECPYPARAGAAKPLTADAWLQQTNTSVVVSKADINRIIQEAREVAELAQAKDLVDGDLESTLPWSEEEELVFHHTRPSIAHELGVVLRALAFIATMFSLAHVFLHSAASAVGALRADGARAAK